ncbi:CopG family transcriptional regulator [bacterium]|nr:CopG family transcriptional regulator [bacterium]
MPKKVARDATTKATIKIPRALYNRLQDIVDGSGFDSVTDFVVYILRDLASVNQGERGEANEILSAQEIELIRKRLRNLGYL